MPMRQNHVFTESEIDKLQFKYAQEFHLSRQMAVVLALLACFPAVTPTTIMQRLGDIQQTNLLVRLRARLRESDEAVQINTVRGFGYYLDENVRVKLLQLGGYDDALLPIPPPEEILCV